MFLVSFVKTYRDMNCFYLELTSVVSVPHIRKIDDNTYQPTTWQIKFDLDSVSPSSTYKFRVALASSALAELQVIISE